MYAVEFTPTARRNLRSLPEKIATACAELLHGPLARNPHPVGKPLVGALAGHRGARRGSYRVVYDRVDQDYLVVLVGRVDHRADMHR